MVAGGRFCARQEFSCGREPIKEGDAGDRAVP